MTGTQVNLAYMFLVLILMAVWAVSDILDGRREKQRLVAPEDCKVATTIIAATARNMIKWEKDAGDANAATYEALRGLTENLGSKLPVGTVVVLPWECI